MKIFPLLIFWIALTSCASKEARDAGQSEGLPSESKAPSSVSYKVTTGGARPIYPMKAASQGIEGSCMVKFTALPDGGSRDHEIISCEPGGYFEEAALDISKKLRITPAQNRVIENITYKFNWNIAGKPK